MDNLVLVIRKAHDQKDRRLEDRAWLYLDKNDNWTCDPTQAWPYRTNVAFWHAEDVGGVVWLRMNTGREIEVSRADLGW
jgi:hypothetical protein